MPFFILASNDEQAPLKVSSEFPSRPNANDPTSKLIRVLGLGCFEITEKIFQHLDYTSVAMLAQTCIGAARAVSDFYTLLDIGDRDFHGQEFLAEELDNLKIAGEIPDHVDWRGSKVRYKPGLFFVFLDLFTV